MIMDSFLWGGGFEIIFTVMFILIFSMIVLMFIVMFVRGIGEWNRNNHSPKLTVDAVLVTKRTHVSHHHHGNAGQAGGVHTTSSTSYYATFQVESGDRIEFAISSREYGMLVEGDQGRLSFQGTRFLEFKRI